MENFPYVGEFGNTDYGNNVPRCDGILESIETFTNEFNLRLAQEMNSMMSMMHLQINRTISSAVSDRVIPKIRNFLSSMSSSGNRDTEASSSSNCQENRNQTNVLKKKDSRSACDLRNTEDVGPYTGYFV